MSAKRKFWVQPGRPPINNTVETKRSWDDNRRLLKQLAPIARPYRRRFLLGLVLVVGYACTILAGPFLLKLAIDIGLAKRNGRALNWIVGGYVAVTVIAWILERAQIKVMFEVGESFLRDLRVVVFDHLQALSMSFYDRQKAGVLVSRMTSDIDSMENLVQQGLILVTLNVVLLGVAVTVLAFVSWQLLLLCAIPVPLVVFATYKFNRDSNRSFQRVRDWIGLTLTSLQEGISGVRVIQAFDRSELQVEKFSNRNQGLYDEYMHSVWISCWYLPIIEFSGLFTTALVIGVGGIMSVHGVVTIGTITFFVLSLSNLFDPVQQLSQYVNQVQQAGAGLVKLADLLDEPVDVGDPDEPIAVPERGEIVVRAMSFGYGVPSLVESDGTSAARTDTRALVLRNIDLTIGAGERIALVGPTGAGKSTLAKIIARFYDPVDGQVTFGGIDLRKFAQADLRRRVCVVPQEGFLFSGTIVDNVRVARADATDDEVRAAFDAIGIRERFEALPDGLATEVHERGSRLSAGEKQLVSLARAALADPAVLILDEATSSLDPGTEAIVEAALERLMERRSVIVIAHRLSTARRADRVGVVADGGIIELGTHDELVNQGGHYAGLYATWVRGLAAS